MNMGYSCAFAWFCWATWVGDSFSPPTTKNSPVYGNIHGTRMCFSMFFSVLFLFFSFLSGFFMLFPWFFRGSSPGVQPYSPRTKQKSLMTKLSPQRKLNLWVGRGRGRRYHLRPGPAQTRRRDCTHRMVCVYPIILVVLPCFTFFYRVLLCFTLFYQYLEGLGGWWQTINGTWSGDLRGLGWEFSTPTSWVIGECLGSSAVPRQTVPIFCHLAALSRRKRQMRNHSCHICI